MDIPADIGIELDAAMEQWTDQRVIETDDLFDLLALIVAGPRIFVNSGRHLVGFSVRQHGDQWRMAIKMTENGTPLVGFVTAATTTDCIRRFWTQWVRDKLTWTRDRYP